MLKNRRPRTVLPWTTFRSQVETLIEDLSPVEVVYHSQNDEYYTDFECPKKEKFIIACVVIPQRYWTLDNSRIFWSYTMNKFAAEVFGLSKHEVLLTRFCRMWTNYIHIFFPKKYCKEFSRCSKGLSLPISGFDLDFGAPTASPLELWWMDFDCQAPIFYAIADLIFLEFDLKHNCNVDIDILVLEMYYSFSDDKYRNNSTSRQRSLLYGYDAIHIVSTKESVVYALPWLPRAALQTREDVVEFCADLFDWFERRFLSPEAGPCPGNVLTSTPDSSCLFLEFDFLNSDKLDSFACSCLGSKQPPAQWFDVSPFFG